VKKGGKNVAQEKNLAMVEAAYELLRVAFAKVYGLEPGDN